jgi:uncharacterized membrane protein YeaQ/YmgE (transglycosylase-associated protein family)
MSLLAWIFLGLISGYIGSRIVNHRGEGVLLDIVVGVAGALIGGFLFQLVGVTGVTGFNIWSMFVAVIGAVVLLAIKHALFGPRHRFA